MVLHKQGSAISAQKMCRFGTRILMVSWTRRRPNFLSETHCRVCRCASSGPTLAPLHPGPWTSGRSCAHTPPQTYPTHPPRRPQRPALSYAPALPSLPPSSQTRSTASEVRSVSPTRRRFPLLPGPHQDPPTVGVNTCWVAETGEPVQQVSCLCCPPHVSLAFEAPGKTSTRFNGAGSTNPFASARAGRHRERYEP